MILKAMKAELIPGETIQKNIGRPGYVLRINLVLANNDKIPYYITKKRKKDLIAKMKEYPKSLEGVSYDTSLNVVYQSISGTLI